MKKYSLSTGNLLVIIAVLAALAWLSHHFFYRADFTADKRYTLSQASRDILTGLQGTVTIRAFFTKDLPPDIARVRQDFRDMLVEYYQVSRGKVVFDVIDPSGSPELEQEALQAGIQPAIVNAREKDQIKQQKVYLGAIIKARDETDVIPLVQPGAAMEYALSSSIKKVSAIHKPLIGFVQGQGEPGLEEMQQMLESMSVLYTLEPAPMHDSIYGLARYHALMLVASRDSFSPAKLRQLDRYLTEGGKLVLALNGLEGNFNAMQGNLVENGLRNWLASKGLTVGKQFLTDAQCANIGVTQQSGGFTFQSQIPFPYFPLISNFRDHPITKGLESVVLQFPVSLTPKPEAGVSATILAETSKQSGFIDVPHTFNVEKQWGAADFPAGPQAVAVLLSSKEAKPWQMVVIASGTFATNGSGQNAQAVQPDNVSLLVNSVDFLSDQTGLMELRTKQVTSRPLDVVTDSRKAFLKYVNFLLPLLLVVAYGIYRVQKNKRVRQRRMQAGVL